MMDDDPGLVGKHSAGDGTQRSPLEGCFTRTEEVSSGTPEKETQTKLRCKGFDEL